MVHYVRKKIYSVHFLFQRDLELFISPTDSHVDFKFSLKKVVTTAFQCASEQLIQLIQYDIRESVDYVCQNLVFS